MPFVLLTSLNLLSLGIASSKLVLCAHLLAALFFCLKLKKRVSVHLTSLNQLSFAVQI